MSKDLEMSEEYKKGFNDGLNQLVHQMKDQYFNENGSQFDQAILAMENMVSDMKYNISTNENGKVLTVVDEALQQYSEDMLSVDKENGMLSVNLCTSKFSDVFMANVAHCSKCDMKALEKELDKRHVGHCW